MFNLQKRFRFSGSMLIAILAAGTIHSSPVVRAQSLPSLVRTVFVPANAVSFTLSLEKNKWGVREKIRVNYRIENVTQGSLYVPLGFESTACLDLGPPHVWSWFENSKGRHFEPGYGASCGSTVGTSPTLTERMNRGTVLLHPGEHLDGTLQMDPTMFGGLPPGSYRIEVVLRGWKGDEFTDAQLTELAKMGSPFLRGEVPASVKIQLIPEHFFEFAGR
jgi:hypothetical protein